MMRNFSRELIAARKARHMTQKQLADAVSVSRSMISHWENGRARPDIESVHRLSQVLGYDFLRDGDLPVEEFSSRELGCVPSHKAGYVRYVLSFLVGLLITMMVLIIFNQPDSAIEQINATRVKAKMRKSYPMETSLTTVWFRQTPEPVADQAHIAIHADQTPLQLIRTANTAGGLSWPIYIHLVETNGVDFTLEELILYYFSEENKSEVYQYSQRDFFSWWLGPIIPAYGERNYALVLPWEPLIGIGFWAKGVDANGNHLEFLYYLELSNEISE